MHVLQLISTKINIDYSVKTNALIHILEKYCLKITSRTITNKFIFLIEISL